MVLPSVQAEFASIPEAAGGTFMFTVSHEIDKYSDNYPFDLYIYTPNRTFGPYTLIEKGATYSVDAYTMDCDKNCDCSRPIMAASLL